MSVFQQYHYEGPSQSQKLDLANIPKECISVTVNIQDEKLKKAMDERIRAFKVSLDRAVKSEEWGIAFRVSLKLRLLEDLLKEVGL
ncbi:hypothetical protein ACFWAN_32715 [Streptomyces mirabilis]|uniref:hypothetical protein n=1 Tax=Streptomyces mirabilis TaxID=68239 RepID=UPI00365F52DB